MATGIGTWVAAIATLGLFSFAWRENKFYSFFEHVYIGISAAHAVVMGIKNIKENGIDELMVNGDVLALVPLILGLLLYTRFIAGKARWSRYPIAVMVGLGLGMSLRGMIGASFLTQIRSTITQWNSIDNVIIFFGVSTVLVFFYFTASRKGNLALKVPTRIGRLTMMIAFGALFGNTVMGRLSMMIGRIQFLLADWLGLLSF